MDSARPHHGLLARQHFLAPLALITQLVAALPASAQPPDRVRVQLNWYNQAQFAGLYVAQQHGLYERERIAIELIEGGPGINPAEVLPAGKADVAVTWLSTAIEQRMRGHEVVNFAQIFRRSGMAIVCRRDAGVHSPKDVAGKVAGVWNIGDELNVSDWLKHIGVPAEQVTLIEQRPDGLDLIERRAACATAMMYNEYWSILRGGLSPSDLLTVRLGEIGLGFLEDGLYARSSALQDERQRDVLTRFLRATLDGWTYARENFEEALTISMVSAPRTELTHQRRMLESALRLIGDTDQIGLLDLASYWRSIDIISGHGRSRDAVRAADLGWTQELWRAIRPATSWFTLSDSTRYYLSEAVKSRWFYLLDLVGTAAFGFAGFMRAHQRRYDLWGALMLTLLPAVGGGTLRDLLVGGGRYPPFIFKDPNYSYVVLGTLAFGLVISRYLSSRVVGSRNFDRTLAFFDTIGMATFAVIGAQVALNEGLHWFWVPFCAALTCAGGGMLLDIVTGREPRTFQGEPYEEIAIVGGILLMIGLLFAGQFEHSAGLVTGILLGTLVIVFTMRMLIIRYGLRSYRLGA